MNKVVNFPRLVLSGTSSGVGKTTVSLALMSALKKRNFDVKPFKVGPDFIDTGYHLLSSGNISRNLDSFMIPPKKLTELFENQYSKNSIAVIEGVMGLFDGQVNGDGSTSTAGISRLLKSPVILVIDGSKIGQSAAALALGYKQFDKGVNLAGVIINNIGSTSHFKVISDAVSGIGIKIHGYLPKDSSIQISERHLGLKSHWEQSEVLEKIGKLSYLAEKYIDLDALIEIAKSSDNLVIEDKLKSLSTGRNVDIAVARDDAFYFYYQDGLEELEKNGANLTYFSPLTNKEVPSGADGLIIGGGFPEQFADKLSENKSMLRSVNEFAASGRPVYAECGGLMYLGRRHLDFSGKNFDLAGVLPIDTRMEEKRKAIGYVSARLLSDSIIGQKNTVLNGHEFHWSSARYTGTSPAYSIFKKDKTCKDGFNKKNIFASYVHLNFAGCESAAQHFIESCREKR